MAIVLKVDNPPIKEVPQMQIELNARRTLDGNVMILDHSEIDIILMPEKNKVVTFAKDKLGDEVYETQDRLFKFLIKSGVIDFNSVQGGNIFSSMEADILESKDYNSFQMTLFAISKFITEERPYMEFEKEFNREEEERLAEPGPEDSTEWDPDQYHDSVKGSLPPYAASTSGMSSIYRI